jgi:hypothetical protein
MSFPRYARYKESGVEWLGEVPVGSAIRKIMQNSSLLSKKILCKNHISAYNIINKTCQGYARKRILKPAGFSFLAGQ